MRIILQQHAAEDRMPQLQAINTIYLNLLDSKAGDSEWQLFAKLASLPLMTTKFIPKCVSDDGYYGMRGKWNQGPCDRAPHCGHSNVVVNTTVVLEPLDHHRLEMGRVIGTHAIQSWWGKQMADALGAAFIG